MNLMTMFWAYREASGRCETYVLHRPQRNFGIAVHNDYDARRWQRYHRLVRKLQRRIEADLAAYDAQATSIADWSKSAGYYHNLSVAYAQKIQELRAALKAVLHSLNAHTEVVWIIPPYQAEAIHESAQERLLSVLEGEA